MAEELCYPLSAVLVSGMADGGGLHLAERDAIETFFGCDDLINALLYRVVSALDGAK